MRNAIRAGMRITSIVAVLLVVGCASRASLTVTSQPEGAYITEIGTGKSYGMAPISVVYDRAKLAQSKGSDGCFRVKGFEARWVSGASASLNPIRLCGSEVGNYNITVDRNPAAPGLEKDLQFVIQLQTLRAQQEQARAASDAAAAALWSAWSAQQANTQQRNNVSCSTYRLGNTLQTDCK